jgi:pimeloyl-ACP methyl ester carboxylesterase
LIVDKSIFITPFQFDQEDHLMADRLRTFWSLEIEQQFIAAYDAVLQQWPVPFEDLYIATRFGQTHVVASGSTDAPPVILLNPGGGSSAIWVHNIAPLSQHYRAYAVDVIGEMNKSVSTRAIKTHAEFIEWMNDLFAGLHIQSSHLIGNSNGGFLCLESALFMPEKIGKVVLISPAATFVQMWAWWFRLLIPAHIIAPLIHSEQIVLNAYEWLWQGFPMEPAYARLKHISVLGGYPRYRPTRNSMAPRVFRDDELRQIQAPMLLLIGDHEVIYKPSAVIQRVTRLMPNLKAEVIPKANHCAQYTAPEAVNQRILDYFAN